jgi:hypothetical protein
MNQDAEHLRLLSIFHYIVAGLAGLFSFFPLFYTTVGAILIFAARHGTPKPGEELPPEFVGWIFAVVGSLLCLLGIAIAICILVAGRHSRNTLATGSHSLSPASNASSFPSEQFSACLRLSCFRANR